LRRISAKARVYTQDHHARGCESRGGCYEVKRCFIAVLHSAMKHQKVHFVQNKNLSWVEKCMTSVELT
jgi:hypothetical protein